MSAIPTVPRSAPTTAVKHSVPAEERGIIRDASWNFYDCLTDALGERSPFRVAFDGRDIEIMTVGPKHEDVRELLGMFVNEVYFGLDIDCRGLGSTTWKRSELNRGIEADLCFLFDPAKLQAADAAAANDSNDVADYPNPDLAIEVDLSPSQIDRPGIYSALRVAEVWRMSRGLISIEQLREDGTDVATDSSRFLHVRPEEITRWIITEKSGNRRDWRRRLQDWIQLELKPRCAADLQGSTGE